MTMKKYLSRINWYFELLIFFKVR